LASWGFSKRFVFEIGRRSWVNEEEGRDDYKVKMDSRNRSKNSGKEREWRRNNIDLEERVISFEVYR
jgi:hypothetical protein